MKNMNLTVHTLLFTLVVAGEDSPLDHDPVRVIIGGGCLWPGGEARQTSAPGTRGPGGEGDGGECEVVITTAPSLKYLSYLCLPLVC